MKRVAVYCGSSEGQDPVYLNAAGELGRRIASRGSELVYGGASLGLMGEVARQALAAGGVVRGVIPTFFSANVVHTGLTELIQVDTMHERKTKMFELADAFIAMPGGFGTLEEISEILTWGQLGLHTKPCGLFNVAGFYDPLIRQLDHSVATGFMHPAHRALLLIDQDPDALIERLATHRPSAPAKWTRA